MDKPTSIKTDEATRDRLRLLAAERGTTINALLKEYAARERTTAEREERARAAAERRGVNYDDARRQGQKIWAKIEATAAQWGIER